MRPRCVILSTLATLVLCGQEATFRTDTRLVVLNVSVFDREGKVVRDLGKTAFTIYENGEKQTLKVFRQDDVPISLGLIIDTSASMTDKRDRVASAALAMVKASNPEDEVFGGSGKGFHQQYQRARKRLAQSRREGRNRHARRVVAGD